MRYDLQNTQIYTRSTFTNLGYHSLISLCMKNKINKNIIFKTYEVHFYDGKMLP